MRAALLKSPKIQYDDPAKKARPHLIVMGGGATTFKPEEMPKVAAPSPAVVAAPAAAAAPSEAAAAKPAKVRKAKAAQNDDPS